jgi:hypothetical protein
MKRGSSINQFNLQYNPLSLYKRRKNDFADSDYDLKVHCGKVSNSHPGDKDDVTIPSNTLLAEGKARKPLMLVCVTMYNEPFSQLLESLAGVFRAYYELVDIDESYRDRVQVCILIDGYDKISENFLTQCEEAGLYNAFKTKKFRSIQTLPGNDEPIHVFKQLKFINENTMNTDRRFYGTNTILH